MTPRLLDIDANTYHADEVADQPTLSASTIHTLLSQSPAHARANHPRLNPDYTRTEESKFDVGNVAHALLLQGIEVAEVIVGYTDWKKQAAREARDLARAHGRVPMLAHQATEVYAMVNAVRDQLAAFGVSPLPFTDGTAERTLVWDEAGVACRARIDWLHDSLGAIDDLKTTSRSAHPLAFEKNLYSYGCDVQVALYLRGMKALGASPEWRWVVVETTPPYALSVITPTAAVLALGDAKVDAALALWRTCLETDTWPAYPTQVCYAELPAWEEARWLAREAREEIAA